MTKHAATGTKSFSGRAAGGMIGPSAGDNGMKKKDSTEVMQVRQSVERNRSFLIVAALLAIVGLIGWLNSL